MQDSAGHPITIQEISDSGHQGGLRYNMKLEYLYIDGYKGLKRLKLQFEGADRGGCTVDFLIGCNGSEKVSVLEGSGTYFYYPYYAK